MPTRFIGWKLSPYRKAQWQVLGLTSGRGYSAPTMPLTQPACIAEVMRRTPASAITPRCIRNQEASAGIGVARATAAKPLEDSVLTKVVRRQRVLLILEREMGLEPTTSSLGSWHSTAELRPQIIAIIDFVLFAISSSASAALPAALHW